MLVIIEQVNLVVVCVRCHGATIGASLIVHVDRILVQVMIDGLTADNVMWLRRQTHRRIGQELFGVVLLLKAGITRRIELNERTNEKYIISKGEEFLFDEKTFSDKYCNFFFFLKH